MATPPRTARLAPTSSPPPPTIAAASSKLPPDADLLLETLQHYRRRGQHKRHAFVVMPDHIHLLLTPEAITLERAMHLIRGGFSHRLASRIPVWQRSFTDQRIRDRVDFELRRNYIRHNPVRARLAAEPED